MSFFSFLFSFFGGEGETLSNYSLKGWGLHATIAVSIIISGDILQLTLRSLGFVLVYITFVNSLLFMPFLNKPFDKRYILPVSTTTYTNIGSVIPTFLRQAETIRLRPGIE